MLLPLFVDIIEFNQVFTAFLLFFCICVRGIDFTYISTIFDSNLELFRQCEIFFFKLFYLTIIVSQMIVLDLRNVQFVRQIKRLSGCSPLFHNIIKLNLHWGLELQDMCQYNLPTPVLLSIHVLSFLRFRLNHCLY